MRSTKLADQSFTIFSDSHPKLVFMDDLSEPEQDEMQATELRKIRWVK